MTQTHHQRATLVLAALVVLGIGAFALNWYFRQHLDAQRAENGPSEEALVGNLRPAFSLADRFGLRHNISEWDGRVVALNFWASWCGPCRREIPLFVELQRRYGAQGLQFVGIAIDRDAEVAAFAGQLGIEFNYPILVGTDEAISVAQTYGNDLGILPYTVLIDRTGHIAHLQFGEFERADAERLIADLLEPKATAHPMPDP
jgi:thiol-disulfide isomerase/thioredoxin